MYEYELHQIRSAELIRLAEERRLVREAVLARRAARRSERKAAEGRVSAQDPSRFVHAA
ncbi:hypothetical protein [Streptomyces sp. NPDC048560]|uniref:hypothetical protein n=1 Tax=Streptomyces sp. NPDC048560 TaxID=3155488 RepID=UPI00341ED205